MSKTLAEEQDMMGTLMTTAAIGNVVEIERGYWLTNVYRTCFNFMFHGNAPCSAQIN
jgi:hypothetical protein